MIQNGSDNTVAIYFIVKQFFKLGVGLGSVEEKKGNLINA